MRVLAALFAALLLLTSGVALACSCAGWPSAAAHAEAAHAIFRGRVVETRPAPKGRRAVITTFEMLEPMKSPPTWRAAPALVDIVHGIDDASCGVQFSRGRETLVAARLGEEGQLHTSLCFLPQYPDDAYRNALGLTSE